MTLRILVTGSRDWRDPEPIRAALLDALGTYTTIGTPVLVHGGQVSRDEVTGERYGADHLAEQAWMGIAEHVPGGLSVEVHRADWRTHGRAAGPIRNAQMVAAGATVCLAFPLGESRGTRGCMQLAERAGIPVRDLGGAS